jgi:hypothetical protein
MKAIERVTPASVMELVVPLIRRYALEPRANDIDRWMTGVNHTADRVGLLVSGDLNAGMSVLTRSSEASGGRDLAFIPDRGQLLTKDQAMMALFRFSFSEPFLNLRADLGSSMQESDDGQE